MVLKYHKAVVLSLATVVYHTVATKCIVHVRLSAHMRNVNIEGKIIEISKLEMVTNIMNVNIVYKLCINMRPW